MSQAGLSEDAILRALAEGSLAETGESFFRTLVRELAGVLGVQYAFVSERTRGGTHFRSRAFWARGAPGEDFEVPAAGSPCEDVLRGKPAFYPEGLQQCFPEDRVLVDWGAVSYGGVPLIDRSGAVVGHLAFLHDAPLADEQRALAVMGILARRAVAEIERLAFERALAGSEARLSAILESASDAILCFDAERRVEFANRAAERLLGCAAAELRGRPAEILALSPPVQRRLESVCAGEVESLYASELDGLRLRRPDGGELAVEGSISSARAGGRLLLTGVLRDVEQRRRHERELAELRDAAEYLREELTQLHGSAEIVGRSPAFRRVLELVALVAATDSTVLIQGETGTGKELVARAIHARSRRADRPLVRVNCAAIPAGLVESELFGHEKGAFTGATQRRVGRFELAHAGTLFLDEIGELPLETQSKLLRVLQEGELERVGGSETRTVDVRVIAATNRNLAREVAEGRLRGDLYFRIAVFPIDVPPLRERPGDVPLLARSFVARHARALGRTVPRIEPESLERLESYPWPGNVRELDNVIQRALILSPGSELAVPPALVDRDLPAAAAAQPQTLRAQEAPAIESFDERMRRHVLAALERHGWRIEGAQGAAQALGIHPNTLRSRMKRLGIRRPSI
jgi:PAS domain S-box-containing protein